MIDRERLRRLTQSNSIISSNKNDQLGPNELKIGDVDTNIVLGTKSIATNSSNPADPGFSFSDKGSEVRHGAKLAFDGDFKKTHFLKGEQILNPLGNYRASSTSDPLPTIMSVLGINGLPALDEEFRDALDNLRSLYGL